MNHGLLCRLGVHPLLSFRSVLLNLFCRVQLPPARLYLITRGLACSAVSQPQFGFFRGQLSGRAARAPWCSQGAGPLTRQTPWTVRQPRPPARCPASPHPHAWRVFNMRREHASVLSWASLCKAGYMRVVCIRLAAVCAGLALAPMIAMTRVWAAPSALLSARAAAAAMMMELARALKEAFSRIEAVVARAEAQFSARMEANVMESVSAAAAGVNAASARVQAAAARLDAAATPAEVAAARKDIAAACDEAAVARAKAAAACLEVAARMDVASSRAEHQTPRAEPSTGQAARTVEEAAMGTALLGGEDANSLSDEHQNASLALLPHQLDTLIPSHTDAEITALIDTFVVRGDFERIGECLDALRAKYEAESTLMGASQSG